MITVAFATENAEFDASVYRALLERSLGMPVEIWSSPHRLAFSGWKSVLERGPFHLEQAAQQGIRHALLAIDNDGGSTRRLQHQPTHIPTQQAQNIDDGCAHCLLHHIALPSSWKESGFFHALAVPVQTLETWLLVLRGDDMGSLPERQFDRKFLKRKFFGQPLPPEEIRIKLALEQIQKPNALDILRHRPSFRLFEEQLAPWISA